MTPESPPQHSLARPAPQATLALVLRVVVNLAAPVLTYVLIRPHVHSDLIALVIGAAIPVAYTAGVLLWRRRLDPVGVIAIVCFVLGLLLVIATGGNELVFKIREDIWTGPIGLVCLISVAVHRPLFLVVLRLAARRSPQVAERISKPGIHRISTVTTAAIGVILLVHAVVLILLALTTSTTTFLAISRPIGLAILGVGLGALVLWIKHQQSRAGTQMSHGDITDPR
jgi:drug/metabolite transporter (DMT)-like permease